MEHFWAGTLCPWQEKQKSNGKIFAYLTRTALPPLLICSFLVWSPWPLAHSFSLYNRRSSGNQRSFLQHGWGYLCWQQWLSGLGTIRSSNGCFLRLYSTILITDLTKYIHYRSIVLNPMNDTYLTYRLTS